MVLTDSKIKALNPKEKPFLLKDRRGLYLLVTPTGAKSWRFRYSLDGRARAISLGPYPAISIQEARDMAHEVRYKIIKKIDPVEEARKAKELVLEAEELQGQTFEAIALEWYGKFSRPWTEVHRTRIIRRFQKHLFPTLGDRPISEIKAKELLDVLRKIENAGNFDTAHRVYQLMVNVFRYAGATDRLDKDVSASIKNSLAPHKVEHYPTIIDPYRVGELLRMIDGYTGSITIQFALRILSLTFCRPGEVRKMEWQEIDFKKAEWSIPARKMKMRKPHLVPLSKQVIRLLKLLKKLTGDRKHVFPGLVNKGRCISENSLNHALRRLTYSATEITPHGFRAMARTMLDEALGFPPHIIEHQLAHAVQDPLGRAYNRTTHLPERRAMMQRWGDYLDELKEMDWKTGHPCRKSA